MAYLHQLEYHITDVCNFSCRFCAHYSDMHVSSKKVSVEDAVKEWLPWSSVIKPVEFWVLGGEPTVHSDLVGFLVAAKQVWKWSKIGLVTNGTLVDRHYGLAQALTGCRLAVSLHGHREEEVRSKIAAMGLGATVDVEFRDSHVNWKQYYQIVDGRFAPFRDGNSRRSWEVCNSKRCVMLRDGKLWKCPQVALAKSVGIDWFDGYVPCSEGDDLDEWLSREEESCCANCPSV